MNPLKLVSEPLVNNACLQPMSKYFGLTGNFETDGTGVNLTQQIILVWSNFTLNCQWCCVFVYRLSHQLSPHCRVLSLPPIFWDGAAFVPLQTTTAVPTSSFCIAYFTYICYALRAIWGFFCSSVVVNTPSSFSLLPDLTNFIPDVEISLPCQCWLISGVALRHHVPAMSSVVMNRMINGTVTVLSCSYIGIHSKVR